ncbi:MAG: hypothetical protein WCY19_02330 [Candidatus Gastranaerophilaceae bacterium]
MLTVNTSSLTNLGPKGKEIALRVLLNHKIKSYNQLGVGFNFYSKKPNILLCDILNDCFVVGTIKKNFGFCIKDKNIEKIANNYVDKVLKKLNKILESAKK